MTKRSIAVALALFLAALAFPLTPSPVMANLVSQTWYLSDTPSGANYLMLTTSGTTTGLSLTKGSSTIWEADVPSNIVCRMSGNWEVSLRAKSSTGQTATMTVDIGILSGGSFTSTSLQPASQVLTRTMTTYPLTVTTENHEIAPGDRLAVEIYTDQRAEIEVNSPTLITLPPALDVDDYPGTVTISLTITDYNSDGINFGSLDAGVTDQPADNGVAGEVGAVILTVSDTTNVDCNILTRGLTNFEASSLANTTGTATGGSATSLVHSGASFLSTVTAGDIVTNTSDKSYAVVTTVTDNDNLVITALSDGGAFADTEGYSIASSTSITSGSATGGSTTSLVDSGASFLSTVTAGDIVTNDTDDTTSVVVAVVSQTELTLSGQADFSTGTPAYTVRRGDNAIAMGNAHWNTSNTTSGYTAMTTEYAIIMPSTAHSETSQGVWYWLSIPGGQAAGTYDSTFYYQAVQQ